MAKDYDRVRGKQIGGGIFVLDRIKPFNDNCELCGKYNDLRPYGTAGEWICHACGQKDIAMTERRMGQILFGDKGDA